MSRDGAPRQGRECPLPHEVPRRVSTVSAGSGGARCGVCIRVQPSAPVLNPPRSPDHSMVRIQQRVYPHLSRHQLLSFLTRNGPMHPQLQLRSGHAKEQNRAR